MPLYNYKCPKGHVSVDRFKHTVEARLDHKEKCHTCGVDLELGLSMGRGLTYFEEGRGQWLENIAPTPQYVTSHGQWRRLLKEHGREWVGARYGEPGCWS